MRKEKPDLDIWCQFALITPPTGVPRSTKRRTILHGEAIEMRRPVWRLIGVQPPLDTCAHGMGHIIREQQALRPKQGVGERLTIIHLKKTHLVVVHLPPPRRLWHPHQGQALQRVTQEASAGIRLSEREARAK